MKTRSQTKKGLDDVKKYTGSKSVEFKKAGRKSKILNHLQQDQKDLIATNVSGSHDETSASIPAKVPARKPRMFSWVIDGVLAGHGRPAQHGHIQFLCDHNIEILITLTENKPRALRDYPGEGLEWKHIPVKDEKPPSVDQVKEFATIVDEARRIGKKVSVHCAWGRGRTGTFMACYLAKEKGLTSTEAMELVRNMRPGSIDTEHQEQTVHDYVATLKK